MQQQCALPRIAVQQQVHVQPDGAPRAGARRPARTSARPIATSSPPSAVAVLGILLGDECLNRSIGPSKPRNSRQTVLGTTVRRKSLAGVSLCAAIRSNRRVSASEDHRDDEQDREDQKQDLGDVAESRRRRPPKPSTPAMSARMAKTIAKRSMVGESLSGIRNVGKRRPCAFVRSLATRAELCVRAFGLGSLSL